MSNVSFLLFKIVDICKDDAVALRTRLSKIEGGIAKIPNGKWNAKLILKGADQEEDIKLLFADDADQEKNVKRFKKVVKKLKSLKSITDAHWLIFHRELTRPVDLESSLGAFAESAKKDDDKITITG